MRAEAQLGGGPSQIEKQHAKGKKTARERLESLLDEGTFVETDMFVQPRASGSAWRKRSPDRWVVTGWCKIDGRLVYVYAQISPVWGSLGESTASKLPA